MVVSHLVRRNFLLFDARHQLNSRSDRCFEHLKEVFPPNLQQEYFDAWRSVYPEGIVDFERTIEEALKQAKLIGKQFGGMQTFVTGSLYLVGGALRLLDPRPAL